MALAMGGERVQQVHAAVHGLRTALLSHSQPPQATISTLMTLLSNILTNPTDPNVKEATVTVLLPTPVVAQVGQPFVASVLIQNNGTRAMNLQLQLRRDLMLGILCSSNVGIVQGKSSVHVSVELLPLIAGLQQIRGVLAVDMDSQVEFAMEKPVYVLVK
ncbi:hypothetical protein DYB36_006605 [Aphanomyces astaci]|uniref:Trafficking protein particle complex subunit 13 C-terminal domain-containing protein n=1 Tax=Aphanomyces astaci TaxID=112090 RepID=A0A397A8F1_APHAT|nr:hypothetical protein DYB36_006605 [Aphanomyces astaci]